MVRDRHIEASSDGLIDPSRKSPGLWHLALFRWSVADDTPTVRLLGAPRFSE
nr:hypothetical protein [Curtobacterium flaccumfaciens]